MTLFYLKAEDEHNDRKIPDAETFYVSSGYLDELPRSVLERISVTVGWYWWPFALKGELGAKPNGPFEMEKEALLNAWGPQAEDTTPHFLHKTAFRRLTG